MSEYIISDNKLVLIADPSLRYVSFPDRGELINPKSGEMVCELMRIVRCRDCKYRAGANVQAVISDLCMWLDIIVKPDGFCAWGERREG